MDFTWGAGAGGGLGALSMILLATLCACRGSSAPSRQAGMARESGSRSGEVSAASTKEESEPMEGELPSAGPRTLGYLEVPDFLPAPIALPATGDQRVQRRWRVFVISHGAGGRGEHHCSFWEPRVPPDVVLVCPQGSLLDRRAPKGGAYFSDHLALRRELVAVRDALKLRFGDQLRARDWRYIGYSQGATMGALAVVGELPGFSELVLIEGGGENWTMQRALDFKATGGKWVLLGCGTRACTQRGEHSVSVLNQAGVTAKNVHAPGSGHTYGGEVGRVVHEGMMQFEEKSAP